MVRLLGGLQRYWPAWLVWQRRCGALRDKRRPSPAVQGLGLEVLHGVVDVDAQVGARLDERGWLPVSLTELGHWHGFIMSTGDGAVSKSRPKKEKQKEEIVWGPQNGGKGGGSKARA